MRSISENGPASGHSIQPIGFAVASSDPAINAGIAAAHRRQRARAAAATKLHADAEQERAKAKCDTDRIDETRQRLPENSAQREQGKGDDTCRHEHDDLRPDAAAAPLDQHVPPRGREAEG